MYYLDANTIFRPIEVIKDTSIFIIVATSEFRYEEVKEQLKQFGLIEFQDFVYWKLLGKKWIYLHGNCHMRVVKDMLNSSKKFNDSYGIYPLKCIQDIDELDRNVIEKADIIISQDIREDNLYGEQLSLDYLKNISS